MRIYFFFFSCIFLLCSCYSFKKISGKVSTNYLENNKIFDLKVHHSHRIWASKKIAIAKKDTVTFIQSSDLPNSSSFWDLIIISGKYYCNEYSYDTKSYYFRKCGIDSLYNKELVRLVSQWNKDSIALLPKLRTNHNNIIYISRFIGSNCDVIEPAYYKNAFNRTK